MASKPIDLNVISELVEKYNHKKNISNKEKKARWQTISNDYNDKTGSIKTGKQLQTAWNTHLKDLRKKQSEFKAAQKKTGTVTQT